MTLLSQGAETRPNSRERSGPAARMAHRRHTCQPAVVPCLFGKRGRAARSVGRNVGSSLLPTQADEPPRSGRGRGICTLTLPCPPVLSTPHAPVAELVDAPDSKSGGLTPVLVRVRPGAPQQNQTLSGDGRKRGASGFGAEMEPRWRLLAHVFRQPLPAGME
jgi:hypothetical protein